VYRACLLLPGPESRRFCVLGDSVLYLLATEAQFDAGVTPSGMHTARACVITNKHLAVRGRAMGLPSLIAPAVGEPGEKRIADSVEALIGAVWFLHGRAAAEKFVCDWIMRRDAPPGSAGDPA
jgi:dsRNA-specific ribonuclease